jgi:hypothetical protein
MFGSPRSLVQTTVLCCYAGNPDVYVAAVEVSDTNQTEIPPTKCSVVDTTMLRSADEQDGSTHMDTGIAGCQSLFAEEPMK